MKRFVEGVDRGQSTLFPDRLEHGLGAGNPVRVIDVFVDELDLGGLGFDRVAPRATGRPGAMSRSCGWPAAWCRIARRLRIPARTTAQRQRRGDPQSLHPVRGALPPA